MKPKLRPVARAVWYGYSLLSVLFLGVIVADLLLIWRVGFQAGVIIYVNKLGEGFIEQLEIVSVIPWIVVTAVRTVEEATRPEKPKTRLTKEEWAAFRQWHADTLAANGVRKPEDRKGKPVIHTIPDDEDIPEVER